MASSRPCLNIQLLLLLLLLLKQTSCWITSYPYILADFNVCERGGYALIVWYVLSHPPSPTFPLFSSFSSHSPIHHPLPSFSTPPPIPPTTTPLPPSPPILLLSSI